VIALAAEQSLQDSRRAERILYPLAGKLGHSQAVTIGQTCTHYAAIAVFFAMLSNVCAKLHPRLPPMALPKPRPFTPEKNSCLTDGRPSRRA